MSTLWLSVLALGGMGLLLGTVLSVAGVFFKIEEDPQLQAIKEALPGANCGGCGYTGCALFAAAVFSGEAAPDACPVGGASTAMKIGNLLGIAITPKERMCAYNRCGGGCGESHSRYTYQGMNDCDAVMQLAAGGPKNCVYGCLGGRSCEMSCEFGAIRLVDGIAVIDNEKCTACGRCLKVCPKKLIVLVPHQSKIRVACNAKDSGKVVRTNCSVGCIACKICEKACPHDAIHVTEQLASIDYDKCTQCGVCVAKCPTKCIAVIAPPVQPS